MFKNFKKHSKLLLLALLFSATSTFSMFAAEPQQPAKPETTQSYSAQKRKLDEESVEKRKEKRQRSIANKIELLRKYYKVNEIMGPFILKDNKVSSSLLPRCGLPICHRSIRKFYILLPVNERGEIIPIGIDACVNRIGNIGIQTEKKELIQEILSYFFDIDNWYVKTNGNAVLNLCDLMDNEKCSEYIKCKDPSLTIYFQTEPTKKNAYIYNIAYGGSHTNGISTFKSSKSSKKAEQSLEEDKLEGRIFEAFCTFCKKNGIL